MGITTEGGIMHARYPDQVGGDNPDIQSYCIGPVQKWKSLRTNMVRCQEDTGVKRTHGYPRPRAGDTVGRLRGSQVSLENSSSLLRGRAPRILWDKFRGVGRRKNSMMWVTCTNSAESRSIRIAESSVMGHSSY